MLLKEWKHFAEFLMLIQPYWHEKKKKNSIMEDVKSQDGPEFQILWKIKKTKPKF